jgi:hypothetical protein
MEVKKGSKIYKQFTNYTPLEDMTGLQWFALEKNYGESYGGINKEYEFIKTPKLLDIGDGNVREQIEETISPMDNSILIYSEPDEQYSGGKSNAKYHNIVKKYYGDEYDGTIIDAKNLKGNEKYPVETLEGPSEIVIWKDYSNLIKEVSAGGKRKRKRKLKTKRKREKLNKSKTIKKFKV